MTLTDCAIIGISGIGTFAVAVYIAYTCTYACSMSRNNHFDQMALVTMWVRC